MIFLQRGKSGLLRILLFVSRQWVTPTGSNPRESAAETILFPYFTGRKVKSRPVLFFEIATAFAPWRQGCCGKPCPEQEQIRPSWLGNVARKIPPATAGPDK